MIYKGPQELKVTKDISDECHDGAHIRNYD
jgi:hypothetical protein